MSNQNKLFMKTTKLFAITLIAGATIVSCGKKEEKIEETPSVETAVETPAEATVLVIESNDLMKYNLSELKGTAGTPIKLTLKHVGKIAKEAMGHNIVILKSGTDVTAFTTKALTAKDTDYIPASESNSIIAHSKLIGGGEEDTIEFTITEKGTYDFLCTFPGHAALMKGKLIIE